MIDATGFVVASGRMFRGDASGKRFNRVCGGARDVLEQAIPQPNGKRWQAVLALERDRRCDQLAQFSILRRIARIMFAPKRTIFGGRMQVQPIVMREYGVSQLRSSNRSGVKSLSHGGL
jgi:hypothetical protein